MLRHEASYAVSHAITRWKEAAVNRQRRRRFEGWLDELRSRPPDVLLGANVDRNEGIRHHLLGIQRYSSLKVELAPPDAMLSALSYHDLRTTVRQAFLDFDPRGITVIHSHVYPYYVEWCHAKRGSGPLWIHTYHAPYLPEYSVGELAPWQKEINDVLINVACNADVRISVSRWQQRYLEEKHGIRTTYVPNGVDVALCDQGDAGRFTGSTGAEGFVLWVGRNDPVKNPGDFVRLAERLPDLRFVMVGGGLGKDQLKRAWNVTAPANLSFTGEMPRTEVQNALAACSALVLTSRREGLPTLVLEGLAHGKPVIVPNDPGCVEALGSERFGGIYAHGDVDYLADRLRAALAATDPTRALGARNRVLAEYDWRLVATRLDAIYNGSSARLS